MLIRGYSDVSISRSGVRRDRVCDLNWGVYFKLDADVREIFPYINGTVEGANIMIDRLMSGLSVMVPIALSIPSKPWLRRLEVGITSLILSKDWLFFSMIFMTVAPS